MQPDEFHAFLLKEIDRNAMIGLMVLVVNLLSAIMIVVVFTLSTRNLKMAREFLEIIKSYAKTTVSETKDVKSQLAKAEENTVKAIERVTTQRRSDDVQRLLTESDGKTPPSGSA